MVLVQLAVKDYAPSFSRGIVGVWLGRGFGGAGLVLGLVEILLNLGTFPLPPAEAGWFDVGPFVGLWYLAATIQTWRSVGWARQQLERSA